MLLRGEHINPTLTTLLLLLALLAHNALATVLSTNDNIVTRIAKMQDIPRAANFLAYNMYVGDVPKGQRNELARLEATDLSKRYGEKVKAKYPSALLLCEEDEEIIGCAGVDVQTIDIFDGKLSSDSATSAGVVFVMSNLAVRADKRKKGYAKALVQQCEDLVRGWEYKQLYLQVDDANSAAKKLYKKLGYKELYKVEDATCVVAGGTSLRTASCVNVFMVKGLARSSSGGNRGMFDGLFGMFNKK